LESLTVLDPLAWTAIPVSQLTAMAMGWTEAAATVLVLVKATETWFVPPHSYLQLHQVTTIHSGLALVLWHYLLPWPGYIPLSKPKIVQSDCLDRF
jgi:hypothetical protein